MSGRFWEPRSAGKWERPVRPTFDDGQGGDGFGDNGAVGRTVDRDIEEAPTVMRALAAAGVDMEDVGQTLETQGEATFVEAAPRHVDLRGVGCRASSCGFTWLNETAPEPTRADTSAVAVANRSIGWPSRVAWPRLSVVL